VRQHDVRLEGEGARWWATMRWGCWLDDERSTGGDGLSKEDVDAADCDDSKSDSKTAQRDIVLDGGVTHSATADPSFCN
jgi:hypothetical protein